MELPVTLGRLNHNNYWTFSIPQWIFRQFSHLISLYSSLTKFENWVGIRSIFPSWASLTFRLSMRCEHSPHGMMHTQYRMVCRVRSFYDFFLLFSDAEQNIQNTFFLVTLACPNCFLPCPPQFYFVIRLKGFTSFHALNNSVFQKSDIANPSAKSRMKRAIHHFFTLHLFSWKRNKNIFIILDPTPTWH